VTPFHVHPNDDEVIFCLEGRVAITFGDRDDVPIVRGSLISLPAGLPHGIAAAADSRMVVMYTTHENYPSERPDPARSDAAITSSAARQLAKEARVCAIASRSAAISSSWA
jgi:uncharacterized RmlC-like cupin family protein